MSRRRERMVALLRELREEAAFVAPVHAYVLCVEALVESGLFHEPAGFTHCTSCLCFGHTETHSADCPRENALRAVEEAVLGPEESTAR